MKIKIKEVSLHNGINFGGVNFKDRLDTKTRTGLVLIYDREYNDLLVVYNDGVTLVPGSNIKNVVPVDVNDLLDADFQHTVVTKPLSTEVLTIANVPSAAMVAGVSSKAQVSHPHDAVFAGLGAGKVRN